MDCPTCKGRRFFTLTMRMQCDYCHGTGSLWTGGGCCADSTWGSDYTPSASETCHRCNGSGYYEPGDSVSCLTCNGMGTVEKCDLCRGRGRLSDGKECFKCHGKGWDLWRAWGSR